MPITAADLEQEIQDEQLKKAQIKDNRERKFQETSFGLPRKCGWMLACGLTFAALMFVQSAQQPRFQQTVDWSTPDKKRAEEVKTSISLEEPVEEMKATVDEAVIEERQETTHEETAGESEAAASGDAAVTAAGESEAAASGDVGVPAATAAAAGVPNTIRELAVKLLGEADAKEFFHTATKTMKTFQKKKLWFWHNKKDQLDFNPDPNYQWDKVRKMSSGMIAIDVGANLGDTAVLCYIVNRHIQILSFEPSPYNYIYARWNLLLNSIPELSDNDFGSTGKPGVLALFGGATRDGRKVDMAFAPEHTKHASTKSDVSGFGFEVPPSIDNSGKHVVEKRWSGKWMTLSVPSFALPAWLKAHKVKSSKIKWFKMDCEGCEYETLIDLEEGGFLKEATVVGEAHFRHIGDLSCEHRKSEATCKDMISQMTRVRKLMCNKHKFSCCSKTMPCTIFEVRCLKKR